MITHVSDLVREYARREYIEPARRRAEEKVKIMVGDVHRALHLHNRAAQVKSALESREFLQKNGLRIEKREGPPSMQSTTVTFTYVIENLPAAKPEEDPFYKIRGIAKDIFRELGGGEAFLKSERDWSSAGDREDG